MNTTRAYVGLGANLGDARATLEAAMRELAPLAARSSLWRSAPVDADGPDYLNAVVALDTPLTAHALLDELQRLESLHGRERPYRHAPRTLDLDLLLFGDRCVDDARLQLPHPRLLQRAFVVRPLLEIAPDLVLPDGRRLADAAASTAGQSCRRLD